MVKPNMNSEIKRLEAEIISWQGRAWKADDDNEKLKTRIKEIAAENESLRMDKKWLQQVIQQMLQQRTPNALLR